jgi:hypothetical protein
MFGSSAHQVPVRKDLGDPVAPGVHMVEVGRSPSIVKSTHIAISHTWIADTQTEGSQNKKNTVELHPTPTPVLSLLLLLPPDPDLN